MKKILSNIPFLCILCFMFAFVFYLVEITFHHVLHQQLVMLSNTECILLRYSIVFLPPSICFFDMFLSHYCYWRDENKERFCTFMLCFFFSVVRSLTWFFWINYVVLVYHFFSKQFFLLTSSKNYANELNSFCRIFFSQNQIKPLFFICLYLFVAPFFSIVIGASAKNPNQVDQDICNNAHFDWA